MVDGRDVVKRFIEFSHSVLFCSLTMASDKQFMVTKDGLSSTGVGQCLCSMISESMPFSLKRLLARIAVSRFITSDTT